VKQPIQAFAQRHSSFQLLDTPIAAFTFSAAIEEVSKFVRTRSRTRLVHFTNVHMLIEGVMNREFGDILKSADLNFPDGMPLVWLGRRANKADFSRVCGPEFMPAFCKATAHLGYRHFFYGGAPGTAEAVIEALQRDTPHLQIAGHYTPPYRPLTAEEDREVCARINQSEADVVWVCLGCPAQEKWMYEHRDKLNAPVLLAVGAAFDFVAGRMERAPKLLRENGLEWLYRLVKEPRRLWRRYLVYNAFFLYFMLKDAYKSEAAVELEPKPVHATDEARIA
jgi:N-acetylglucosaminyldiphosphoundecaprenol N-acetyl-beta-D-mannosaminyltransferase